MIVHVVLLLLLLLLLLLPRLLLVVAFFLGRVNLGVPDFCVGDRVFVAFVSFWRRFQKKKKKKKKKRIFEIILGRTQLRVNSNQ